MPYQTKTKTQAAVNYLWFPMSLVDGTEPKAAITLPEDGALGVIPDVYENTEPDMLIDLDKLVYFLQCLPHAHYLENQYSHLFTRLLATAIGAYVAKTDYDYFLTYPKLRAKILNICVETDHATLEQIITMRVVAFNDAYHTGDGSVHSMDVSIRHPKPLSGEISPVMIRVYRVSAPEATVVFDLSEISPNVVYSGVLGDHNGEYKGAVTGVNGLVIPVFDCTGSMGTETQAIDLANIGLNETQLTNMVLRCVVTNNLLDGTKGVSNYVHRIRYAYEVNKHNQTVEISFMLDGLSYCGKKCTTLQNVEYDASYIHKVLACDMVDIKATKVLWATGNATPHNFAKPANFGGLPEHVNCKNSMPLTQILNQAIASDQLMGEFTQAVGMDINQVQDSMVLTGSQAKAAKAAMDAMSESFSKAALSIGGSVSKGSGKVLGGIIDEMKIIDEEHVPVGESDDMKVQSQNHIKGVTSLSEAVANAKKGMAQQAQVKENKLQHKPSTSALGAYFKTRVKAHFGKTVTLNPKAFGQLKQLITRLGENKVYRTMQTCLDNWDEFLAYVKEERNWEPDCKVPNMGILLHLADEMSEFYSMKSGDKDVDEGKTAYQTDDEVKQSNSSAIKNIWND
ncbi:hypothetical protein ACRXCV_00545 (plasmid) [Halobacteriovorax sp. GFR7]|uniref:hypothetical protein n=1 Tax=unclassified Halobacteriovorax TaxID=2639665 RepID=UPI003D98A745